VREWTEAELARGWRYIDRDEPYIPDREVEAYMERQRVAARERRVNEDAQVSWDRPLQGPTKPIATRWCDVCMKEMRGSKCCL
jgi:hypothetical protein